MMMCIFEEATRRSGGMPSIQLLYDEVKLMLQQIIDSMTKKREKYAAR